MIFETYKPTGILRNHVENYLVVKTEQAISEAIIPETSPILSFRSKGQHSYWVNDTLREAVDKDYRLTVLADCCADSDEEVNRVLTTKIFPRHADVLMVGDWNKI